MPKSACPGQPPRGRHIAGASEAQVAGPLSCVPTSLSSVVQTIKNGSVDSGLCNCVDFNSEVDDPAGHLQGARSKFTAISECEPSSRVPEAPGTVIFYFNFLWKFSLTSCILPKTVVGGGVIFFSHFIYLCARVCVCTTERL